MKFSKDSLLLYAVTDRSWSHEAGLCRQVEAALQNGVTCLQLREKNLNEEEFLKEALEIGRLCRQYGAPFIINDNVEIAIKCQADGIHIVQEDMDLKQVRNLVGEHMVVGVSAHTVEEARTAQENGADYLGLGSVFSTSTKKDVQEMSAHTLRAICQSVTIPTVAIGGISEKNIHLLKGSQVDGIAVVSAIFKAPDPGKAAAKLKALAIDLVSGSQ